MALLMATSSGDCFGTNRGWDMLDLSSRPDGGHHPSFSTEMLGSYFLSREIEKEAKKTDVPESEKLAAKETNDEMNSNANAKASKQPGNKESRYQKFTKYLKFW